MSQFKNVDAEKCKSEEKKERWCHVCDEREFLTDPVGLEDLKKGTSNRSWILFAKDCSFPKGRNFKRIRAKGIEVLTSE